MKNTIAPTVLYGCTAIFTLAPSVLLAKDNDEMTAPLAIFQAVLDCREVIESMTRLACFDEKVETLAVANDNKEIILADKGQIKEERIERLETTVISASKFGFGKWVITLAEGGTWQQTDSVRLIRDPRPGDPVTIKTGAIGSYMANINGQRAIRVKQIK
ncbi:MAG: hypothetical protein V7676_10070 [Parasphingorhabdus sp.]|uniref:hypothetical protein n=1 Tax=Parasphingorhabdus sp. TaxID=2709688 RepID=UPI003002A04D